MVNKETIKNLFRSNILLPETLSSNPGLKFKINIDENNNLKLNNKINLEEIKKNIKLKLYLNLSNVNFYKNKIIININIENINISNNYSSITEYSFSDNKYAENSLQCNDSEFDTDN